MVTIRDIPGAAIYISLNNSEGGYRQEDRYRENLWKVVESEPLGAGDAYEGFQRPNGGSGV